MTGRSSPMHIDMTPMVDVMMLLVIFFMMSTVFIADEAAFAIQLPTAASGAAAPSETVGVQIAKDGQVAVGGKPVTREELAASMAAVSSSSSVIVAIRADREASHGQVVEVMDVLRKAGVVRLSIVVNDKGR